MSKKKIKIKYFDESIPKIEKIAIGDWIDLRVAEEVFMESGDFKLLPLNVAMELPESYEAIVAPRSSTYKNFHIIAANSIGVIDNSYCGDNDQWLFPAIALEDTLIPKGSRICQFRIQRIQPAIEFVEVDHLDGKNRGGFGTTGTK